MKQLGKTIIVVVLLLSLAYSAALVIWTYRAVEDYMQVYKPTGKAAGRIEFCINTPPSINLSDCPSNATEDIYYDCLLSSTDSEQSSFLYSSVFTSIDRVFGTSTDPLFSVNQSGFINFTPTNDDVGNFTIALTTDDRSGCTNGRTTGYLYLEVINVNDPPYLSTPIPDISFRQGEAFRFYLQVHFDDPENDPLNYTVSGNSAISVSINNNNSEVVISSATCPAIEYVLFSAFDPSGASADSNLVKLECVAGTTQAPSSSSGGSGSGGGSGLTLPCKSVWECFDYHRCNASNVKVQKCVDIKGCEKDRFLTVPCVYQVSTTCLENWTCTDWTECSISEKQTRECTDLGACGTDLLKPPFEQECEYIGTCNDGIKNCHDGSCEEDIDCGGPCGACRQIQVPYPFKEESSIGVYIMTGLILLLLSIIFIYHYFKKEINATLAKAGWLFSRKKRKQILLQREDKVYLLAEISRLEKRIPTADAEELTDIYNKYSELLRHYILKVLGKHIHKEFDLKVLDQTLTKNKKRLPSVLNKIFLGLYDYKERLSHDASKVTKDSVALVYEELKNIVLQTSVVEPQDLARDIKEIQPKKDTTAIESLMIMVMNAYIALEYVEIDIAKKKYLEILSEYEKLDVHAQEDLFDTLGRLYHAISYVNSWASTL